VAVGLVAIAAGVLLRFVATSPLWLDEALSVNIASLPLGELVDALRRDGHPPLYYALLHGWMGLVGDGDVAVRALSGLFAVGALPLAWLAGRRRGGPVLAWIAVTVLALSPYALRYATETRMYAMVSFLVFAGYLLVDDVVRRGRRDWLRVTGIAVVAAALLYSHYWSLWLLAATVAVLGTVAWRRPDLVARDAAARVVGAVAVAGVAYLPWVPVMLEQAAHTGTPWAGRQRPVAAAAITLADIAGGRFQDAGFVGAVLLVLMLLAVFGRALDGHRILLELRTEPQFRAEAAVAVLAFGLGVGAAVATGSAYASRYAAVVFPFLVLLVAGGLTRFVAPRVRLGAVLALVGLSLLGVVFNVSEQRSQSRVVARAISGQAAPGDLVVFCPDQLGPSGSRELAGVDVEVVAYPTLGPAERVDWYDYAERNAVQDPAAKATEVARRAGPARGLFVVWNGTYRTFEGQCEALVEALGALRPGGRVLVPDGSGRYYEPATVVYFPPVA
jgi:uncharacterized membrane protein